MIEFVLRKKKILLTFGLMLILLFAGIHHGPVLWDRLTHLGQPKATVLMYHHLTEDPAEINSITITAERMEEDLKWLQENGYQTVLPRELLAISEGKDPSYYAPRTAKGNYDNFELGDKLVVITFDDGYASNYHLLFPLLQKYNMKAEINLIGGLMYKTDNDMYGKWYMFQEMSASGLVEIGSHTYNLHNPDNRGEFKYEGANGVQGAKGESPEEIRERVTADLEKSQGEVISYLKDSAVSFAYPYGTKDKVSQACVEEAFRLTFITKPGPWYYMTENYNIPRSNVNMDVALSDVLK